MLDIYNLLNASYAAHALYAATTWGVMDQLNENGATDTQTIATTNELRPDILRSTLLTLQAFGYLQYSQENDLWSLGARATKMYQESEGWLKDFILLWGEQLEPAFARLADLGVTEKKTGYEIAHGHTLWEHYRKDRHANARFVSYMDGATRFHTRTAAIAEALQLKQTGLVVDIGGASARLMTSVLLTYPDWSGQVFDQPHLQDLALKRIADSGMDKRCSFVGGNFLTSGLPTGADAYLLKHVLHDWADVDVTTVLVNISQAMTEHSRLYIIEGVLEEEARSKLWLKTRHLEQVVWTGGKVRTLAEFQSSLSSAGLEIEEITDTDAAFDCTVIRTRLKL